MHGSTELSARRALALPGAVALAACGLVAGCGVGTQPLMPTPVIYTDGSVSPLEHIPANERWKPRRIYYATTRERTDDTQQIGYGNDPSEFMSVGLAFIGFGGPEMTWSDLARVSTQASRDEEVDLSVTGVIEGGRFPVLANPAEAAHPEAAGFLLEDLNDAVEDARDKDILIYVHGAKVNFYNGCAFAAQLDHFMGRDMTSVAFSWPTRQDIFAYAFGNDVQRGYDAAEALATLIEVLAAETDARRIHVLSWSAGARVATRGIELLRTRYPDVPRDELRRRFRVGTAYFAAGDIPVDEFLDAIEDVHGLSDQLVVTGSSHDEALVVGKALMGGEGRIGQKGNDLTPEQEALLLSLPRLQLIDVSLGAEERGFDITGHRYWFDHPWASSDVLLSIRTDLSPPERGLEPTEYAQLWAIPEDYPERLQSLRGAEARRWDTFEQGPVHSGKAPSP